MSFAIASPTREIYTSLIAAKPNPHIFLSAGEASGDGYGAQLIRTIRASLPEAGFTGLGGPEMAAAGQHRIVRAEDVAVMGITEILRHIPRVYARYRRLVRSIRVHRPDAAVLIDFPDVNFRLARHLRRAGVPVLWLVSPQLWAWKRRRLRWVQERVDRMFVIFPFEQPFYEARGVAAEFIGHPLAELPRPATTRQEFAQANGFKPDRQWIALLPGSRQKEILANLPAMLNAAQMLHHDSPDRFEFLLPVASTLEPSWMRAQITKTVPSLTLVRDAREALHHARASVVASGTATVQAALLGNPFVVVYRVSPLTLALAKRLVHYPAEIPATPDRHSNLPVAMPNLIAGRRIVPELLNDQFTGLAVAEALLPLLNDGPERAAQVEGLAEIAVQLRSPAPAGAIATVAAHVISLLGAAGR